MVFPWFSYGFPLVFQKYPASPCIRAASGTAQGGFAVPLVTPLALRRAGPTVPGVERSKNIVDFTNIGNHQEKNGLHTYLETPMV